MMIVLDKMAKLIEDKMMIRMVWTNFLSKNRTNNMFSVRVDVCDGLGLAEIYYMVQVMWATNAHANEQFFFSQCVGIEEPNGP